MTDTAVHQRGDTIRFKVTLYQGARADGARLNLTGATLRDGRIAPPLAQSPAPAFSILDAPRGEVMVHFTPAQTAAMAHGRVHQVRIGIDFPSGDTDVIPSIWIDLK